MEKSLVSRADSSPKLKGKVSDSLRELKETAIVSYWAVREGFYFFSDIGTNLVQALYRTIPPL